MLTNILFNKTLYQEFQTEEGYDYYLIPAVKDTNTVVKEPIAPICTIETNKGEQVLELKFNNERCKIDANMSIYYIYTAGRFGIDVYNSGDYYKFETYQDSFASAVAPHINRFISAVLTETVLERVLSYLPTIKTNEIKLRENNETH